MTPPSPCAASCCQWGCRERGRTLKCAASRPAGCPRDPCAAPASGASKDGWHATLAPAD
ncbi:hypothetical protein C8Q78DRAFT_1000575 [Trametes maxima]|nr:hypothetical protein C8Q78DRAFT_1000575 [Trametes maxima]